MKSAAEILVEGLAARGVPALFIGGTALPAYGVERQTIDLDCLVAEADAAKVHGILSGAGYVEKQRTEIFARYSHLSVYLMDIDVMYVDQSTFQKMDARSQSYHTGSVELRVPCVAHLVALKLHAIKNNPKRELKDMGDVTELLRNNANEVPLSELEEICVRYGPLGIYGKLKGYL